MSTLDPLSILSIAALRHVTRLHTTHIGVISEQLYSYNRYASSPELNRAFPNASSIYNHLLLDDDRYISRLVYNNWRELRPSSGYDGWRILKRRPHLGSTSPTAYKLYVSPTLEFMQPVLREVLIAATTSEVTALKFPRTLDYLLRPDKIIVYFSTPDAFHHTTTQLISRIEGAAVHGTPFTCALVRSGLLSWGMDPPKRLKPKQASWRGWLTNELAIALAQTSQLPFNERLECIRQHVRSLGVDPLTWAPEPCIWEVNFGR